MVAFTATRDEGAHAQALRAARHKCAEYVEKMAAECAAQIVAVEQAAADAWEQSRAKEHAGAAAGAAAAAEPRPSAIMAAAGQKDKWWGVEALDEQDAAQEQAVASVPSAEVGRELQRLAAALREASAVGEVAGRVGLQTAQGREFEVEVAARAAPWVTSPTALTAFSLISPVGVREVACGYNHAMAVVASEEEPAGGVVWAWGANSRGQLGLGHTEARFLPTRVPLLVPAGARLKVGGAVSCGKGYSMFLLEAPAPAAHDTMQTMVLGCGRNERDQLGLNHASEIRSWLWQLGAPGGWQGLELARADRVQAALEASGVCCWHQVHARFAMGFEKAQRKVEKELSGRARNAAAPSYDEVEALEKLRARRAPKNASPEQLRALRRQFEEAKLAAILEAHGVNDKGETAALFLRARDKLLEVYPANVRRSDGNPKLSRLHWVYSAHDHLQVMEVPQGIFVARDGKVFVTDGVDRLGGKCKCQQHAGVATSDLTCEAHGQPLGWEPQLADLAVYPPKERWRGPSEDPTQAEAAVVAKVGDLVRVGVYPQDGGVSAGGLPENPPGLKNVSDGPQHGDDMVQRQIDGLARVFDDPLSTCTSAFFYDGAVHYPSFAALRKSILRIQCGDEYTAVTLSNGENRFLGDIVGAVRRLQSLPPRSATHTVGFTTEVSREQPKVAKVATAFHLGVLGVTEEKTISKAKEKEHLLVRARRGAQKPRALLRITFSQLQRLAFPFHTR